MAKRKNKETFAETPNAKKTKVVLEDASSSDFLSKVSTAKTFNRPLMKSASKTYDEVSLNSIGQSILFLFSFRERLVEINMIDEPNACLWNLQCDYVIQVLFMPPGGKYSSF